MVVELAVWLSGWVACWLAGLLLARAVSSPPVTIGRRGKLFAFQLIGDLKNFGLLVNGSLNGVI